MTHEVAWPVRATVFLGRATFLRRMQPLSSVIWAKDIPDRPLMFEIANSDVLTSGDSHDILWPDSARKTSMLADVTCNSCSWRDCNVQ